MTTTHPPSSNPMPKSDQCVKGINWGQYTLEESKLSLKHNQLTLMALSLKTIQSTSVLNKNEVVMEMPFDTFNEEWDFWGLG